MSAYWNGRKDYTLVLLLMVKERKKMVRSFHWSSLGDIYSPEVADYGSRQKQLQAPVQ